MAEPQKPGGLPPPTTFVGALLVFVVGSLIVRTLFPPPRR
jgi:hypothetical protein